MTELKIAPPQVPETVFFILLDDKGNPVEGATCKADMEQNGKTWEKSFDNLKVTDVIDPYVYNIPVDKGLYVLTTDLKSPREFSIKIVCINPDNQGVASKVIDQDHIPCDLREGGKLLVC
ncbi:hypothetical protein J4464_00730 [Candidatus Woesearchaeota archaeon]|nr:hypothetical protein [Candidatus Woesearchaeota archaeon]